MKLICYQNWCSFFSRFCSKKCSVCCSTNGSRCWFGSGLDTEKGSIGCCWLHTGGNCKLEVWIEQNFDMATMHMCACMHLCAYEYICVCITNQINHIKQTWAIYNPHIHACVYHVCIECVCVCEMHAHACALHLCVAHLCAPHNSTTHKVNLW